MPFGRYCEFDFLRMEGVNALNLFIMGRDGERFDTGVNVNDVDFVIVRIVYGDESLEMQMKSGGKEHFDLSLTNARACMNGFDDGEYFVHREDLAEWNQRKSVNQYFCMMEVS